MNQDDRWKNKLKARRKRRTARERHEKRERNPQIDYSELDRAIEKEK